MRFSDAFVLRRSQLLLASRKGRAPAPDSQKPRRRLANRAQRYLHASDECGLGALTPGSSRPKEIHAAAFDEEGAEEVLRELLHRSPRDFSAKRGACGPWRMCRRESASSKGLTLRGVTGETTSDSQIESARFSAVPTSPIYSFSRRSPDRALGRGRRPRPAREPTFACVKGNYVNAPLSATVGAFWS